MKAPFRILRRLFALENIFLTISIIAALVILLLDAFSDVLPEVLTNSAILLLLLLLATHQLVERMSVLPRLERMLYSGIPLLGRARVMGLKDVYRTRADIPTKEILDTVVNGEEVDLLGVSHSEIIPGTEFMRFMQDVRAGRKKLRLLLLNPTSSESLRREEDEGETGIRNYIRGLLGMLETRVGFHTEELSHIIRLYNYAPSCMIIRSDNVMYVVHYVFGRFGGSPAQKIEAVPEGLFYTYLEHFERVWEHAQPFQGVDALDIARCSKALSRTMETCDGHT